MLVNSHIVAGIDEVGRGPLFGPVVACAVIFNKKIDISNIKDSKKISISKRKTIYNQLMCEDIDYGIGIINENVIDKINILNATKEAMLLAVKDLKQKPDLLLIDGNQLIKTKIKQEAIVKGDEKISQISAASIIAKVTRDKIIDNYAMIYPMFGLNSHKGYGTKKHIEKLYQYGPTKIHRKTFKPVADIQKKIFLKYESSSICNYAIYLIKQGIDIDFFKIEKDYGHLVYKCKKLNVHVISLDRHRLKASIKKISKKIIKKDSVNKVRLDVIYSDDKNIYPKVINSCEIF